MEPALIYYIYTNMRKIIIEYLSLYMPQRISLKKAAMAARTTRYARKYLFPYWYPVSKMSTVWRTIEQGPARPRPVEKWRASSRSIHLRVLVQSNLQIWGPLLLATQNSQPSGWLEDKLVKIRFTHAHIHSSPTVFTTLEYSGAAVLKISPLPTPQRSLLRHDSWRKHGKTAE